MTAPTHTATIRRLTTAFQQPDFFRRVVDRLSDDPDAEAATFLLELWGRWTGHYPDDPPFVSTLVTQEHPTMPTTPDEQPIGIPSSVDVPLSPDALMNLRHVLMDALATWEYPSALGALDEALGRLERLGKALARVAAAERAAEKPLTAAHAADTEAAAQWRRERWFRRSTLERERWERDQFERAATVADQIEMIRATLADVPPAQLRFVQEAFGRLIESVLDERAAEDAPALERT